MALAGALLYGNAAGSGARSEAVTKLDEARRKETEAQALLTQAQQRAAAQEQVSGETMAVWQLLTSSEPAKQDEGLMRAAKLDRTKLTAFTRDAIERTAQSLRRTRAEDTLAAAFGEGKPSEPHQAAAAFERFLGVAAEMPAGWHATERLQAAYQLGALYNGLGEHDRAVPFLRKAVAGNLPAANKAYAYLLLGDSLDRTSHHAEAEEAFKAGLELKPSGLTSSLLKKRLGPDAPT